jgi:restriction system protein
MARRYGKSSISPIIFRILVFALFLALIPTVAYNLDSLVIIIFALVALAGILAILLLFYIRQQEQAKLKAITISQVDYMSGVEFEQYLGEILKHQGFAIEFTKVSGDFGTDIVAKMGKLRYSIQAKRRNKHIDRSAISDAVAAKRFYNCNRSMVITNNYFSKDAKRFAYSNFCKLIDRERLAEWMVEFQKGRKDDREKTTQGSYPFQLKQSQLTHSPTAESS